jgi:hypothetical protein
MLVEEEYFEGHYRGIKVDFGDYRFYSLDCYFRLNDCRYTCEKLLKIDNYELCYVDLGGNCKGVIVRVLDKGIEELISLRLKVSSHEDPAKGDLSKARKICLEKARVFMEDECNGV